MKTLLENLQRAHISFSSSYIIDLSKDNAYLHKKALIKCIKNASDYTVQHLLTYEKKSGFSNPQFPMVQKVGMNVTILPTPLLKTIIEELEKAGHA